MTSADTLVSVGPDDTLEECGLVMSEMSLSALPVIHNGEFLGVVSLKVKHCLCNSQTQMMRCFRVSTDTFGPRQLAGRIPLFDMCYLVGEVHLTSRVSHS